MPSTPYAALVIELYVAPALGGEGVVRAARERFRPLLGLFDRHPGAQATVALDPGLALELLRQGQAGVLQSLAAGVERGQIELAAGSRNHALLPRLPRAEVERQLKLGDEALRETLGRSWRPRGLYPPALAYARQVAEVAADRGLRWILADELALGDLGVAPADRVAALRGRPDVLLFFRDRALSGALADGGVRDLPRYKGYRVAVVSGAAFPPGSASWRRLEELFAGKGPSVATLSGLTSLFPDRAAVEPLPSTWRTTPAELAAGIPFALWSAPDNELQALLWRLASLGLQETARLAAGPERDQPEVGRMRALLDEGLHSASFRFASGRPFWEPDAVRDAARRLASAIASGGPLVAEAVRAQARSLEARVGETVEAWERDGVPERLRSELSEEQVATICAADLGPIAARGDGGSLLPSPA